MTIVATVLAVAIICLGGLQNLIQILQLIISARALSSDPPVRRASLVWRRYADLVPPVALLSPAYNEATTIVESVRSLLALKYPHFEVVVINDGSSDDTLGVLAEAFDLHPVTRAHELTLPHADIRGLYGAADHPRLLVIDKENGGKADALNAGLNLCRAPVVCAIDADSLLERDSLMRGVRPFVEDPSRVVAVGGTIRVANGCKVEHGRIREIGLPRHPLALLQTVEYLRAFLLARLAWSRIGALTLISGAFGLFRRSAVIEAGGYSRETVGEDMELILKLHRAMRDKGADYIVSYVPEPVCWTEVPESLTTLARQRMRWQRGALQCARQHADMTFNPRYGRIGTLGLPYIWLTDVAGPIVELAGYILLPMFWASGVLSVDYFLAFLAVSFAFGVAVSTLSLLLSEVQLHRFPRPRDLAILTATAVLENFGYRQLANVWRLQGCWQFLRGTKGWGAMTRKGFRS